MDGAVIIAETMSEHDDAQRDDPGAREAWLPPADEAGARQGDGTGDEPPANLGETVEPAGADAAVEITPERVVEAILFSADTPMPASKIASILGVGDGRDVRRHIKSLNARYQEQGSSFRIEEIAGGFRMMTLPAYNRWLVKLLRVRQETKLSAAAMETLAIVAYKQPCTRADIEAIRGVAAGDVLNRLREMNLVKIVGRAEDLGRPMLYGTTKRFLEVFGLPGLEDLPQVEALRSGATAGPSQTARPDDKTNEKAADGPTATETDSSAQPPGRKRRGKNKPAESDEGQPDQTGIAASAAIANGEPHSLEHPPERAVVMPNGTPIMRLTNDEDAGDVIDEVDDDAGASDALPDEDDVSDEGDE